MFGNAGRMVSLDSSPSSCNGLSAIRNGRFSLHALQWPDLVLGHASLTRLEHNLTCMQISPIATRRQRRYNPMQPYWKAG